MDKEKQKLTFEQECSLIANGEDLPQEKQIELVARELLNACAWRFGRPNDYKELFNDIAEYLAEQGYRKLPKDSVVYKGGKIYYNDKHIGYIEFSFYEDIKALGFGNFEIIDKRKGYGTLVIKDIIHKYKDKYNLIYCFVDKNNIGAVEFYKKVGKVCFDITNDKGQYQVILYGKEDSVVLSMEEIYEFRKDQAEVKFLKKQLQEKARKETAEKILAIVGNIIDDGDDRFKYKDYQWHKDLCKQFGVEIKE